MCFGHAPCIPTELSFVQRELSNKIAATAAAYSQLFPRGAENAGIRRRRTAKWQTGQWSQHVKLDEALKNEWAARISGLDLAALSALAAENGFTDRTTSAQLQ